MIVYIDKLLDSGKGYRGEQLSLQSKAWHDDHSYREWQRQLGASWRELSEEVRAGYCVSEGDQHLLEDSSDEECAADRLFEESDEFGLGTKDMPISENSYEGFVKDFVQDDYMPGLTAYDENFRDVFADMIVVI